MKKTILALSFIALPQLSLGATITCGTETPFANKFSGTIEVSKLASANEPNLTDETGSADLTLTRTETAVLPDGTTVVTPITSTLTSADFQVSSEFLPAGHLMVHDATIVNLNLPDQKVGIRIILEMPGANGTAVYEQARYTASCRLL